MHDIAGFGQDKFCGTNTGLCRFLCAFSYSGRMQVCIEVGFMTLLYK